VLVKFVILAFAGKTSFSSKEQLWNDELKFVKFGALVGMSTLRNERQLWNVASKLVQLTVLGNFT
jgi:hypothetical protein